MKSFKKNIEILHPKNQLNLFGYNIDIKDINITTSLDKLGTNLEVKARIKDVMRMPINIFTKKCEFLKRICPKGLNKRIEATE